MNTHPSEATFLKTELDTSYGPNIKNQIYASLPP